MDVLEKVTQLADRLSPPEQLRLVEHLARRLQTSTLEAKKSLNLYGSWRGKFPEDINVEADIREIRDEWKKELDEL
ncbi:MAG: hypothetical protein ACR2N3_00820 [Pyrinomonadaceae bacterium]